MMNQTPIQLRTDKLGERVVKALERRHFEACYCRTKEEARKIALSYLPEGSSVAWGGSVSIEEIGLLDAVRHGNYSVIDRDAAYSPEEKAQKMHQAFFCDTFLTSTNALSEDGQLVNIDGNGNRVAAMIYGPKQVIIVAGINKVTKTVEDALVRARTVAAPINAQRFPLKTPCLETGACADCTREDSICAYIVTTRICRPAGKIKVILVGEALGF